MDFELAINYITSVGPKAIIDNPQWKESVKIWLRGFTDDEYKEIDPQLDLEQSSGPQPSESTQQHGSSSQPYSNPTELQFTHPDQSFAVSHGTSSGNNIQNLLPRALQQPTTLPNGTGKKRKRRKDADKGNVQKAIRAMDQNIQHEEHLSKLRKLAYGGTSGLLSVSLRSPGERSKSRILPFNEDFSIDWKATSNATYHVACARRVLILCMAHRVEYTEKKYRKEKMRSWNRPIRAQIYAELSEEIGEPTDHIGDLISAAKRYMDVVQIAGPSHLLEIRPDQSHVWENKIAYVDIQQACEILRTRARKSTAEQRERRSFHDFCCVEHVIKKLRGFGESFAHLVEAKTTLTETLSKFVDFESLWSGSIKQKKRDFYDEEHLGGTSTASKTTRCTSLHHSPERHHQPASNSELSPAAVCHESINGPIRKNSPAVDDAQQGSTCQTARSTGQDQSSTLPCATSGLVPNGHENSRSKETDIPRHPEEQLFLQDTVNTDIEVSPQASITESQVTINENTTNTTEVPSDCLQNHLQLSSSHDAVQSVPWEQSALQQMEACSGDAHSLSTHQNDPGHRLNAQDPHFNIANGENAIDHAMSSIEGRGGRLLPSYQQDGGPHCDDISSVPGDGQDTLFHLADPFDVFIDTGYFTLDLGISQPS